MPRKPNGDTPLDDWCFLDYAATAKRFGLSADAISTLAADPTFPVLARKICPALMREWLLENRAKLKEIVVK